MAIQMGLRRLAATFIQWQLFVFLRIFLNLFWNQAYNFHLGLSESHVCLLAFIFPGALH